MILLAYPTRSLASAMKPTLLALASVLAATVATAQTGTAQQGSPAQPTGTAQQQTQDPPQPTFRTGVDVITIDVGAVDGRGQPVTDLHGPEFTVKIDGQVRRVVSADLVKCDYAPDNGVTRRPAPKQQEFETLLTTNIRQAEGRMIMIAVDQMNIRPGAARPILDSAKRFLDKLNPADRVAFVSYPEPGVVVDFTGDRQRLRLAMEKVIGTQSRFVGRRNIGLVEAIDIAQKGDDRRMQEVTNRECRGLLDMALEQCMRDIVDESNSILWTTEARHRGLTARAAPVAAASRRDRRAEDADSPVGRAGHRLAVGSRRRRADGDARPCLDQRAADGRAAFRRDAGPAAADLHRGP